MARKKAAPANKKYFTLRQKTKAIIAANSKWQKENYRAYMFRLSTKSDGWLIEFLDDLPSKAAFIKEAVARAAKEKEGIE